MVAPAGCTALIAHSAANFSGSLPPPGGYLKNKQPLSNTSTSQSSNNMAKIHFFSAGYCTHPACVAVRGAGWRACEFPARVFLFEVRGRFWLWDTGYANHFFDAARGVYRLYRWVTPVYFSPEQGMAAQLAAQGLRARDLSGIILSHFHGDHIAGLKDFPAVPLIASGEGWAKIRRLRGLPALLKGFLPDLMPQDVESRLLAAEAFAVQRLPENLKPFERGWALPESGGEIVLLPLPGHAAGHLGAFVHTERGWVLLAADAAWSQRNFRAGRPPAAVSRLIMDDAAAFQNTLNQLAALSPQIPVYLSHELEEAT
ncbi:MBL fold metallo-hydrolase [Eikenella sp. Marseille-P7795]|uniref:MBL fold metallo-hydrolase n=1 Tax=Eikenella sp. Marseille-P7795 TaxID=2866577 RepID=UPI001CE48B7A|nr:MBL fold metallo-hydrolase [Eikenella sp. Marseille-P7795]